MQLTRFDRWLLRCFVYETHIHTLSDPGKLPRGIRRLRQPDKLGQQYKYHFVTRSERAAKFFIARLKAANQMFTTRIVNRRSLCARLVAPVGKSFSWKCIWIVLATVVSLAVGKVVLDLSRDPEIRRHVVDAIEVLKG